MPSIIGGSSYYTGSSGTLTTINDYITIGGSAIVTSIDINTNVTVKKGISPQLYFNYVKRRLGSLEKMRVERRLKSLEKAFDEAVGNGQSALAEKFLLEVGREARESLIAAKGVKLFIEKHDLDKHKKNIRDGHISDTRFEQFTRVIPKDVLEKKKKVEGVFDGFVIYHYWDEKAEKNRTEKQKMSSAEHGRMRDPILFGWI